MIAQGRVTVNGEAVTEMGIKVDPEIDKVALDGKLLERENFDYILLNKPKNTITSMSDPDGRPTVMDLIRGASKQRLYPVGRLDRQTTGLLLFTNDGKLADKLMHPSAQIPKLYHVLLDRPLSDADLKKLRTGVILEDGLAKADRAEVVLESGGSEIGIELHIGRNRIVRRMFEYLGYRVERLDRTGYGPLNKKGIPRGEWRRLKGRELQYLQMLPAPKRNSKDKAPDYDE
jgi:23S rRNA pseudouridine2605 synthase